MIQMANAAALTLALAFTFVIFSGHCNGALQVGFYKGKCQSADVEAVVSRVVASQFRRDPTIAAALLRMQFHDCFVNGCDASILLNGPNSEKTASPNLSVRGYDIIDAAKAALEEICPEVVSCADIIVMATRDAVSLSGGRRYVVQTGRRDGNSSLAAKVFLPSPTDSVSDAIDAFASKGLNATDLVYLLGAHTVGLVHCSFFHDRLYNFDDTGKPDPNMDPSLVKLLRTNCPEDSGFGNVVNLDQNSSSAMIVDNSFYKQILRHRGVLQIDQDLATDPQTNATVAAIAKGRLDFSRQFGNAMVKLGAVQVLTGNQGEIRISCRVVNQN